MSLCLHRTNFIVTASSDGVVKFWKKQEELIEFVKHFRSHLMAIQALVASCNGVHCATISIDKTMKVFDVVNFGKYSRFISIFSDEAGVTQGICQVTVVK